MRRSRFRRALVAGAGLVCLLVSSGGVGATTEAPLRGVESVSASAAAHEVSMAFTSRAGARDGLAPKARAADKKSILVLGDSFSAGNGGGSYYGPSSCYRSTKNYGWVLAREVGSRDIRVAACSGAVASDIASSDRGRELPPQIRAITRTEDLIVLTLGGNDAQFSKIVQQCLIEATNQASSCNAWLSYAERLLEDGSLGKRLSAALRAIDRAKAPNTRVALLGYPFLEGRTTFRISDNRQTVMVGRRLRALQVRANTLSKSVVAGMGDQDYKFFSVQGLFNGPPFRGLYADGTNNPNRWLVKPFSTASKDTFYHPNVAGWQAEGRLLAGSTWIKAALNPIPPVETPDENPGDGDGGSGGPTLDNTPGPHRTYIAIMRNSGPLRESINDDVGRLTQQEIVRRVQAAGDFWVRETDSKINSFDVMGSPVVYDSALLNHPDVDNCGRGAGFELVTSEAAKRFPGVNFDARGNHLVVIFSQDCLGSPATTSGLGSLGSGMASGGSVLSTINEPAAGVLVHELGHNLGLGHSGAETCYDTCHYYQYGDLYDIMGGGGDATTNANPALNSVHRQTLGLLTASEVTDVRLAPGETTRTFELALRPRSDFTGLRTIRVSDPMSNDVLFFDYRSGTGRDSGTFYTQNGTDQNGFLKQNGVLVLSPYGDRQSSAKTHFLSPGDAHPEVHYILGEEFVSDSGAVTVQFGDQTATSAAIVITLRTS